VRARARDVRGQVAVHPSRNSEGADALGLYRSLPEDLTAV
jgi:hypothetical protein